MPTPDLREILRKPRLEFHFGANNQLQIDVFNAFCQAFILAYAMALYSILQLAKMQTEPSLLPVKIHK